MDRRDHTGKRGESIAIVRLTEVCQENDLPYFLVHFLGDKSPLFDAMVELVAAGNRTPFFLAQVKSTRKGYNEFGRLQVTVSKSDVVAMVLYPAPTYIVGIDERTERAFIIGVHDGMDRSISTMNTEHELNCSTLKLLWDEVVGYWKDVKVQQKKSRFAN
jgi:hypothetical protein